MVKNVEIRISMFSELNSRMYYLNRDDRMCFSYIDTFGHAN